MECTDCGLLMLNPQPSDEGVETQYDANYALDDGNEASQGHFVILKRATARGHLRPLRQYIGGTSGALLEIGFGQGDFLLEAQDAGYVVTGVDISSDSCKVAGDKLGPSAKLITGTIESLSDVPDQFDVCVLSDVLEHVRDPRKFLAKAHHILKPNGVILIAIPTTDSWSAKWMRSHWIEFKPEHLFYFSSVNLQSLLFHLGFGSLVTKSGRKTVNLNYIDERLKKSPVPLISKVVSTLCKVAPENLRTKPFEVVASGILLMARAEKPLKQKRKLSIVVPAFNEGRTFEPALQKLLAKKIDDLEIEIVIVESNSSDGTREAALRYQDHPRVTLVLEDRPRGKGFAVRNGLNNISGDFVMIQDADLEYDLEDYEALLEPLIAGKTAFVLGARHGGNKWKMRSFKGHLWTSLLYNLGHWLFVGFFDLLYWVLLKDPTTMFKVFRKDCLYGLIFECNRFDFDWELVAKLIRKGYKPIEIPVNYRSRSADEGKKVDTLKDPWTWVRAIIKYRFVRLRPLKTIQDELGCHKA